MHCFFPAHFYGTETYTLQLAKNLQALGHEPIVVSAIFPGEQKNERVVDWYDYDGIPVYCIDKNHYPNTRVKDTYYQPEISGVLDRLLEEIRPDLIHVTHLINHTGVLLEVAASRNIPLVATFTDFFGFCYNNKLEAADGTLCNGPNPSRSNCLACHLHAVSKAPAASRFQRLAGAGAVTYPFASLLTSLVKVPGFRTNRWAGLVLDIARRPDILGSAYSNYRAAITPTKFLRDAYAANGFTLPMHDIHFGVDVPRSRKPLKNRDQPIRFGFIGQIAPHKGVDILIDAFCQLPKGKAELHIYGPEDQDLVYMRSLREKARDYQVSFHGTFPKEQIVRVFADVDLLVIPSRWYENSPLVLLNSLASHTPVIVSNVAGMTEFIEEGRNGFTFERGSAFKLAAVMRSLVDEPDLVPSMSEQTDYLVTTRTMTEAVLSVYETVLNQN